MTPGPDILVVQSLFYTEQHPFDYILLSSLGPLNLPHGQIITDIFQDSSANIYAGWAMIMTLVLSLLTPKSINTFLTKTTLSNSRSSASN